MPDTPAKLSALTQAAIEALPGDPGSRGWVAAFRATLARAHTAAYLAATAERLNVKPETLKGISRAERADITRAVDAQLKYLAGFQQAIPDMSDVAIAARAQLYSGPVKTTYYATRWGDWDIPPSLLPGNQQCLGNCLCRISVTDDGDGKGTLTRTMGGTEHHCTECPPLQGDHPVKRRGAETKAQTAEERAMFANMGRSKGGSGFGPGGKPTGGQGGLWPKGADGKRRGPSASAAPKPETPGADAAKPPAPSGLHQAVSAVENKIRTQRTETAHVFGPDGKPLFTNDGGKDYVEISPSAFAKIKGKDATLTHNHPGGWDYPKNDPRHAGNSFSLEDARTAVAADLAEIRAVTPTRTYSLKRPAGGWNSQQMERAYADANKQTRQTFTTRIQRNEMTIAEAEAQHTHTVWLQVSRAIGADYSYEGTW